MSPVLPDEVVGDRLGGRPATEQADIPDELGGQR